MMAKNNAYARQIQIRPQNDHFIPITTTSDANFLEARANIEKADRVVVSQVWDPYAYIELGLAMQLNKQIVVVGDDDLIQTGLFPKYDDFVYEKAPEDTVSQYLTRLSKSEN